MATAHRLEEFDSELARAVFRSPYASRAQRVQRPATVLLLAGSHTLRGMLSLWPLHLMAATRVLVPAAIGVFSGCSPFRTSASRSPPPARTSATIAVPASPDGCLRPARRRAFHRGEGA